MKAAIINASNTVVNVIEIDPKNNFKPGPGLRLIKVSDTDLVGPGWTVNGNTFVAPSLPESDPTPEPVDEIRVDKEALAKSIADCKNLEHIKTLLIRDILPLL